MGKATRLLYEQTMSDFPYHLQQWIVAQPGLLIKDEEIAQAFPDIPTEERTMVINQLTKASMIYSVGPGTYYKNMRTIEARGIREI